jgi:hypothetical protein
MFEPHRKHTYGSPRPSFTSFTLLYEQNTTDGLCVVTSLHDELLHREMSKRKLSLKQTTDRTPNCVDCATAAAVEIVPTFASRGLCVLRATDPYGRYLGFLDRSRYFSFNYLVSYPHEAKWTSFQTQYLSENPIAPGIESGTSGCVSMKNGH